MIELLDQLFALAAEQINLDDREAKDLLDKIARAAKDRAQAQLAAERGTHTHELTEDSDHELDILARIARGEELGLSVDVQEALVAAWEKALQFFGFEVLGVELTCVDDIWRQAGTLDRIVRLTRDLTFTLPNAKTVTLPAGWVGILDIKTGRLRLDDGGFVAYWLSYAVQVASYAQSRPYDPDTDTRTDWPWDIDQKYAIIAHLDVLAALEGEAVCRLVLVDLEAGRHAGNLCVAAREWERRTDVFSLVTDTLAVTVPVQGFTEGQSSEPSGLAAAEGNAQVTAANVDGKPTDAATAGEGAPELSPAASAGVAIVCGGPAGCQTIKLPESSPAESHTTVVGQPDSAGEPIDFAKVRRDTLRARYQNLNRDQKLAYCALGVDKDDLDAVEAALNEVDPFAKPKATTAKCRSCDADIVWAVTENDKRIPLDAEPTPDGNLILVDGVARAPRIDDEVQPGSGIAGAYVSHFATCPNADKHRAPKPAPPDREGGPADPATVAALQARFGTLAEAEQAWIKGLLKEANAAGVPFHNGGDTGVKSIRRFELSRAVVRLAQSSLVDPLPAEVARGLAENLAGGDTAGMPLGEVLGGFGAELATQFALDVDKYLADLQGEAL